MVILLKYKRAFSPVCLCVHLSLLISFSSFFITLCHIQITLILNILTEAAASEASSPKTPPSGEGAPKGGASSGGTRSAPGTVMLPPISAAGSKGVSQSQSTIKSGRQIPISARARVKKAMLGLKFLSAYGLSATGEATRMARITTIAERQQALKESTKDRIALLEKKLRYEVDFMNELFEIIGEAKLLELMGFTIPDTIRDVGMQEDRLHVDLYLTQQMVKKYNIVLDKLTGPEVSLTKHSIKKN